MQHEVIIDCDVIHIILRQHNHHHGPDGSRENIANAHRAPQHQREYQYQAVEREEDIVFEGNIQTNHQDE
ncbi:hypothetical protein D3C75_473010 [compost metagenome]